MTSWEIIDQRRPPGLDAKEFRDLWLQREVGLGKVIVHKVDGPRNPADLTIRFLKRWEIELRLTLMGIRIEWSDNSKLDDQFNSLLCR